MAYKTDRRDTREGRWLIPAATVITFLLTFSSTFLLTNPSVLYGREVRTADDVGTVEDGFCRVAVAAPDPALRCGSPVRLYEKLRQDVIAAAGFDFLAKCGDMKRQEQARFSERGVSNDSKHKLGLAFDYNQEDPRVLIVREDVAGLTYWRTYLRCQKQDGTCGVKADVDTDNAGRVSAYLFDFTDAAERYGWERIPAQEGWEYSWKKKEFWHYQLKSSVLAGAEVIAAGPAHDQKEQPSAIAAPLQFLKKVFSLR